MTVQALAAPDERLPEDPTATAAPAPFPAPEGAPEPALAPSPAPAPDAAAGAVMTGVPAPIGVRALESGVIQVTLPANEEIGSAEARVAGAAVRALADGRRVPVMLVISGVVGVSVDARQVYVSSIAASAFALVGESPVDRVIAHYLLRSRTKAIPAQFFTSEAEAVEWLGQYTSED